MDSIERHNAKQVAFYERVAAGFDTSIWSLGCRDNRNHEAKVAAIAAALDLKDGMRVVEVGVGTGLHARWMLANTGVVHTGVDLSEPMLRLARQRLSFDEATAARTTLALGDACRLPFADGEFDAAYCSGTLHHVADPPAALREIARVVGPGGRVAALEPNPFFPSVAAAAAIPEERGAFRIRAGRLIRWGSEAGLTDVSLQRLLYTPPRPKAWRAGFDKIDATIGKIPGLKRLSITLLLSGTVS